MSEKGEKIKFLYDRKTTYDIDQQNAVGATKSLTLRTLESVDTGYDVFYVKKWGTDYSIGSITNAVISTPRSDVGGVNTWTYDFQGWNGTAWVSMGSVQDSTGASQAFSAGSSFSATKVKIVITCDGGAVTITNTDTIVLTTDINPGGLSVVLAGEGNTYTFNSAWGTLTLYLSHSGSTYYDTELKYGGGRHTPVIEDERYPFFHPTDVMDDASWGQYDALIVMDSEHYQVDNYSITDSDVIIQSALGQTPTFCNPIGASEYRDTIHDGNNDDTIYVGKIGSDTTGDGTYQKPYATHVYSFTNRGTRAYINTIDSETYFDDNIEFTASMILEPLYGHTPTLKNIIYGSESHIMRITASITLSVYGYTMDGTYKSSYGVFCQDAVAEIICVVKNCTIFSMGAGSFQGGISLVSFTATITIENNNIYNSGVAIQINADGAIDNATINNNMCHDNEYTGIVTYSVVYLLITNNVCWRNSTAILIGGGPDGVCENNTLYDNNIGLYSKAGASGIAPIVFRNMMLRNNATYDCKDEYSNTTLYNTNYENNSGFIIDGSCITTAPELCKSTFPYKLGISALSGAYHTDSAKNNMGVMAHILSIEANDTVINNIIFDGQGTLTTAILKYGDTNYTGLSLEWCDFKNYQGIAVDIYDNDTDTSINFSNCNINNNGQGVALAYGGNTLRECLFFKNDKIGLWCARNSYTIDNCVFSDGEYGVYFSDTISSLLFTNSIIANNALYGIYAGASISIMYCDITSAISDTVNISNISNITDNPLFVDDVTQDSENFHLKVKERGYTVESPCINIASDGGDLGCYIETRTTDADDHKKFTLTYNPHTINEKYIRKGGVTFDDAQGNHYGYRQSSRLLLPMDFGGIAGNKEQRLMMRFFAEREVSGELGYIRRGVEFLISKLPTQYFGQGTGIIDTTDKTLTDTNAEYFPNEKKGYWVNIAYSSGTSAVIDATAKTLTDTSKAWTVDEWTGYKLPCNGYYYYVLSNTSNVLTLSDANSTLINNSAYNYDIIKYYKILENTKTVLTLRDDDSELPTGNYKYIIDFIKMVVIGSDFGYNQTRYNDVDDDTKQDYSIDFIEVD